jgi:hypothetical protein
MKHVYTNFKPIFMAVLALLAGGCATAPLYQSPDSTNEKAFLKFKYTENNFSLNPTNFGKPFAISSVAKVSKIEGDIVCNKPLPNPQTVFVRNHGNPLVSEVNKEGVWIAAERKFIFSAMSIPGPSNICGRIASFTPKAGVTYLLRLDQSEGKGCSVDVLELKSGESPKENGTPVTDFQFENCKAESKP